MTTLLSPQSKPHAHEVRRELALLVAVLAALYALASPLSDLSLGLDNRYSPGAPAAWLGSHIGQVLLTLGLAGYLSLWVARAAMPVGAAALAWLAVWLGSWDFVAPAIAPTSDNSELLSPSRIGATLVLLALPVAARLSARHWLPRQAPVHAAVYPGFVLFTGVGALWLLDYAARGRPQWGMLGVEQMKALFMAYAALGLAARWGTPLFAVLARLWAVWDRSATGGTWGLGSRFRIKAVLPWLVCAVLITLIAASTHVRFPSKGAELIRMVACFMGAWVLYRWSASARHAWRAVTGVAVMVALTTLGLLGIHDFGQLMVLSWAAAVVAGAVLGWGVSQRLRSPAMGAVAGTSLVGGLVWGGQILLRAFVPYLPGHIADRVAAVAERFTGKLEYLSELRWFMQATPWGGHGLAEVPWCGSLGQFGQHLTPYLSSPARCTGVPKEMHSDYVFAGLVGVWGWPAALVLTGALALWLLSLLRHPGAASASDAVSRTGLAQAFGLCFVTVTLMQLLVTCLGSVGAIPLTGVNFPFLGFGGASLLVCAVSVGVLMHQPVASAPISDAH